MTEGDSLSKLPSMPNHRPIPDPTVLTTQQLYREIGAVREVIGTRLDAMDKALELLQRRADRVPSETDVAIAQLRGLQEERFNAIENRISEMQTRTDQTFAESKVAIVTAREASEKAVAAALQAAEKAVAAALQAAKEAVAEQNKSFALATSKSEATTTKQIDQIGTLLNATVNALNDKIDDIRARLTTIEGSGKGSKDLMAILFTVAGIAVAIVAAIIAFTKLR